MDCERKLREAKDEADRQRRRAEELEQRERAADQERADRLEASRREIRERLESTRYVADDWPEAFQKQIERYQYEIRYHRAELAAVQRGEYPAKSGVTAATFQKPIDEMTATIEAIKSAREIYLAEMSEAEAQIKAIRAAANGRILEKLKENKALAATGFEEAFRDDDPSAWLYW